MNVIWLDALSNKESHKSSFSTAIKMIAVAHNILGCTSTSPVIKPAFGGVFHPTFNSFSHAVPGPI